MKIIDARSGKVMKKGDAAVYGSGEWIRLHDVRDRFYKAEALIEANMMGHYVAPHWSPLAVRFTHPSFFLQRVAFIPT